MRKLSKYEKETIINWNEAENLASVYTFNASLKRRLADFSRKYPLLCRLERSTPEGSVTYVLDKSRLSIRLVPPYSEERKVKGGSHYRVKDEVPWRVEGSRPIGSRVKRLAQGELMPASTRTGYYLTQNSQDLRLRRPFPGPRTSSQEGGNLFETDTTQWTLRQAWHL
mgnify:CR=1 FL=1